MNRTIENVTWRTKTFPEAGVDTAAAKAARAAIGGMTFLRLENRLWHWSFETNEFVVRDVWSVRREGEVASS